MKEKKMIGRVRYVENYRSDGEHFLFEWKYEDDPEEEWTLEVAAKIENDMIHYTALTQIREWQKHGITDIIWK